MCHTRIQQAIYKWSNYVRTIKYIDTIDTTNVSFHGVRSIEDESRFPITLKGTDTRISTRISLCHSGFKGPYVSELFQGIVTYNNLPGLLFGFFMNTQISPTLQLTFGKFQLFPSVFTLFLNNSTFPPLFPQQGRKYMNK